VRGTTQQNAGKNPYWNTKCPIAGSTKSKGDQADVTELWGFNPPRSEVGATAGGKRDRALRNREGKGPRNVCEGDRGGEEGRTFGKLREENVQQEVRTEKDSKNDCTTGVETTYSFEPWGESTTTRPSKGAVKPRFFNTWYRERHSSR